MKIEKVSATIRYSQDTGHGAWRVIELGAEASISDKEQWKRRSFERREWHWEPHRATFGA